MSETPGASPQMMFGSFRVDLGRRLLFQDEKLVPISTKAFDTLEVFITHAGQVLDREQLIRLVWPGTFVDDNNLSQQISILRKLLDGEDNGPTCIKTIPRRGYLFSAKVETLFEGVESAEAGTALAVPTAPLSVVKRMRFPRWVAAAALGVLGATGVLAWRFLARKTVLAPSSFCHSLPLTSNGDSDFPAISADSSRLAYVTGLPGAQSLWIQDIQGLHPVALLSGFSGRIQGLSFHPGGTHLYMTCYLDEESLLLRVPLQGGKPEPVMKNLDGPVAFSPDGRRMAFWRTLPSDEVALCTAGTDGGDVRALATCRSPKAVGMRAPGWSPDGQWIAAPVTSPSPDDLACRMAVFSAADGKSVLLPEPRFFSIGQTVWRRDGKGIYAVGRTQDVAGNQVWRFPWPFKKGARRLTDRHDHWGLGLDQEGRYLVTAEVVKHSLFWKVPLGPNAPPAESGAACPDLNSIGLGMDCLPDGRMLVGSDVLGTATLFRMGVDGSERQVFLAGANADGQPTVSRAGKRMAFTSRRGGSLNIWTAGLDGKGLRQLTHMPIALNPSITPDGEQVFFSAPAEASWSLWSIWRVGLDGSAPVRVFPNSVACPTVSPDGHWLGFNLWEAKKSTWRLAVIPATGGEARLLPARLMEPSPLAWTPDSQALVYMETSHSGVSNLFRQPLGPSPANPLTAFKEQRIFRFTLSHDGRTAYCERGDQETNVVQLLNPPN